MACGNYFWSQLLRTWAEVHYRYPQNGHEVMEEIIWYNSNIKINKNVIKKPKGAPVIKVDDLLDNNYVLLRYCNLAPRVKKCINWWMYMCIVDAFPKYWLLLLKQDYKWDDLITQNRILVEILLKSKHCSALLYNFITIKENVSIYMEAWNNKLVTVISYDDFCVMFKNINKITKNVKLCNFQYRLLYNKIFVNNTLFYWKKVPSKRCEWCNHTSQDIIHLLIECPWVTLVWEFVENLFCEKMSFMKESIIFNTVNAVVTNITNSTVLLVKYVIFQQKCLGNKPSIGLIRKEIIFLYLMEYQEIRICTKKHKKFDKRWKPVLLNKLGLS